MSPEERELLNRSVALAEENNNILHAMRRSMRLQRIMTLVYWVFIIGSAVGAYYIIQPYLADMINIYGSAGSVLDSYNSINR